MIISLVPMVAQESLLETILLQEAVGEMNMNLSNSLKINQFLPFALWILGT